MSVAERSVAEGRRAAVAALACAVVVVAGVIGAPGARAQTGCTAGLVLMAVPDVLRMAAPGSEAVIRAGDQNHDGYLCVQTAPGGGLARYTSGRCWPGRPTLR